MVIKVEPDIKRAIACQQCPVCGYECIIKLGRHKLPVWDDPTTGTCQHLKKFNGVIMIFLEDWELNAMDLGAKVFVFPHVDGVPEDNLLQQCRKLLSWQAKDPVKFKQWRERLRG